MSSTYGSVHIDWETNVVRLDGGWAGEMVQESAPERVPGGACLVCGERSWESMGELWIHEECMAKATKPEPWWLRAARWLAA